jgi:putative transposase
MMWLTTAHVRRYHQHYHSSGHVWQGRFRAFPIQEDNHLLSVLRYIERNPVRAKMVERAEDWRWSSAAPAREGLPVLTPSPVPHLLDWLRHVNEPQTDAEVESLRDCIRRRRPYGSEIWSRQTAGEMGLQASLRPRGRPPRQSAANATLLGDEEAAE